MNLFIMFYSLCVHQLHNVVPTCILFATDAAMATALPPVSTALPPVSTALPPVSTALPPVATAIATDAAMATATEIQGVVHRNRSSAI